MNSESKGTDEVVQVTFPYDSEAGAATIDASVITVTVLQGVDAAPANILLGAAQIVGAEVRQLLKSGVAGVRYKIRCLATMNDTRKLARNYTMDVVDP